MKVVCPCCSTSFPVEAGLVEGDAKRLGALLGDMEPPVARAAMSYLRFFKPAKQELRVSRAVAVLQELAALINVGRVARDERSGIHRPCTPAMWVQGIEQLQTSAARLELPLKNHNYLRAIVYGLADSADAKAEVQRHKDAQQRRGGSAAGPVSAAETHLAWARDMRARGIFNQERYEAEEVKARAMLGDTATTVMSDPTSEQ